MKIIDSAMEEVSCLLVDERRSSTRHRHATTPFSISGILRCSDWLVDRPVHLINYRSHSACVLRVQHDARLIDPLGNSPIVIDFYLEQQCVKTGIPIRVVWNQLTTSGMLGVELLAHSQGFGGRVLRYLCHRNIAPQIKARDPLDVNRNVYFNVVNISPSHMLISTSMSNQHLLAGMFLEPAELFVPATPSLSLSLAIQNTHETPWQDAFYLEVSVTGKPCRFEKDIPGYLSMMSSNF